MKTPFVSRKRIERRIESLNQQRAANVKARQGKSHMIGEMSKLILEEQDINVRIKELESLLK
jgi:hypothetical protein